MLKPKRIAVATAAATAAAAMSLAAAPQASAQPAPDGTSVCGPLTSAAAGAASSDCSIQILGGVLGSGSHSHDGAQSMPTNSGGGDGGTSVCGPLTSTAADASSDCSIQILGGLLGSGSHSTQ